MCKVPRAALCPHVSLGVSGFLWRPFQGRQGHFVPAGVLDYQGVHTFAAHVIVVGGAQRPCQSVMIMVSKD